MSEEAENEQLTIRIKDGVSALFGPRMSRFGGSRESRRWWRGVGIMAGDVLVFGGIVMGFDPARRNSLGAFGILGFIILVIMYPEVAEMVVVVVADGRCGAILSGGSNFRP